MAQTNVDVSTRKTATRRATIQPTGLTQRFREIDARQILKFSFTVAPLLAGADKFGNLMVDWEKYLAPVVPKITKLTPRQFMRIAGVVEIAAGLGVAARPRIFSRVAAAWLGGIISNLLIKGEYYDIALRDLGLLLSALALGKLSSQEENFQRSGRHLFH